jgi:predicted nucleotidyltransferase
MEAAKAKRSPYVQLRANVPHEFRKRVHWSTETLEELTTDVLTAGASMYLAERHSRYAEKLEEAADAEESKELKQELLERAKAQREQALWYQRYLVSGRHVQRPMYKRTDMQAEYSRIFDVGESG